MGKRPSESKSWPPVDGPSVLSVPPQPAGPASAAPVDRAARRAVDIDLTLPVEETLAQAVARQHRRAVLIALVALVALNTADLVTTRLALARGGIEANPLAKVMLSGYRVEIVKAVALLALAWRVMTRTPTLWVALAAWAVTGVYAMTVVSNILSLVALSR